jgi:hypothetical protein
MLDLYAATILEQIGPFDRPQIVSKISTCENARKEWMECARVRRRRPTGQLGARQPFVESLGGATRPPDLRDYGTMELQSHGAMAHVNDIFPARPLIARQAILKLERLFNQPSLECNFPLLRRCHAPPPTIPPPSPPTTTPSIHPGLPYIFTPPPLHDTSLL